MEEREMKNLTGEPMRYEWWFAAFRYYMDASDKKQVEVADELGISKGYLNSVYNRRETPEGKEVKASDELQEKIANYFQMDYLEFVQFGKNLTEGKPLPEIERRNPPALINPKGKFVPDAIIKGAMQIADHVRELNDKYERICGVVYDLPDAVAITDKNCVITYQNHEHILLFGKAVGKHCLEIHGTDSETCPAKLVLETGIKQNGVIEINGAETVITASPVRTPGREIDGAVILIRRC